MEKCIPFLYVVFPVYCFHVFLHCCCYPVFFLGEFFLFLMLLFPASLISCMQFFYLQFLFSALYFLLCIYTSESSAWRLPYFISCFKFSIHSLFFSIFTSGCFLFFFNFFLIILLFTLFFYLMLFNLSSSTLNFW